MNRSKTTLKLSTGILLSNKSKRLKSWCKMRSWNSLNKKRDRNRRKSSKSSKSCNVRKKKRDNKLWKSWWRNSPILKFNRRTRSKRWKSKRRKTDSSWRMSSGPRMIFFSRRRMSKKGSDLRMKNKLLKRLKLSRRQNKPRLTNKPLRKLSEKRLNVSRWSLKWTEKWCCKFKKSTTKPFKSRSQPMRANCNRTSRLMWSERKWRISENSLLKLMKSLSSCRRRLS